MLASYPVPRRSGPIAALFARLGALVLTALSLSQGLSGALAPATPRVAPQLLTLAATAPAAQTSVIVRRDQTSTDLNTTIVRLGGRVDRELALVHSLVAELPAGALPTLGRTAGVSWVSANATIKQQQCIDCISTTSATANWLQAIQAKQLWQTSPTAQGQGVTVAVLDSGIADHADLTSSTGASRIVGSVPMQRNLVFNAGFEAGLQSWTDNGGLPVGEITMAARNGSAALLLPRNNGSGAIYSVLQELTTFVPGQTYTLSAWGRMQGFAGKTWVGVQGFTKDGIFWGYGFWFAESNFTRKSQEFTVPANTSKMSVFVLNGSSAGDLYIDDIAITPKQVLNANPLLFAAMSAVPQQVNLSTEGTLDWMHWGRDGQPNNITSRSGGNLLAYQRLGGQALQSISDGKNYTWTNGQPIATASSNSGVAVTGLGNGFEITAPADTNLKTLRIYAGALTGEGKIEAFMSDNSSPPYVSTGFNSQSSPTVLHTISYRAAQSGQKLTVRWTQNNQSGAPGAATLFAASLTDGTPFVLTNVETSSTAVDQYGHGTHVAGIIAGNGKASGGQVIGVAPAVSLVNVRVNDANGEATVADVIDGMQWIYENRAKYNIRVLNISLNSSVAESYNSSPIAAAAEILWFSGIVVVVSAGNNGPTGVLFPPANDPFVISVGATDDKGTPSRSDDALASFSALGWSEAATRKPEIAAPGTNIVSLMCPGCVMNTRYAQNTATGFSSADKYFRASGTSMAAPMVAAAAALILQRNPGLNPDQVKYRLISTGATTQFGADSPAYLNVNAAVNGSSTQTSNTGLAISTALTSGNEPMTDSARWGSARWGSARWGSVNWSTSSVAASMKTSMVGSSLWDGQFPR